MGKKRGVAFQIGGGMLALLAVVGVWYFFLGGPGSFSASQQLAPSLPVQGAVCDATKFAGQDEALLVTGFHLGEDSNVTVVTLTGNLEGAGFLSSSTTYQSASRTVKHGAGFNFAVRNTSGYFGGIYSGNIACDSVDSLEFPVASRGGVTLSIYNTSRSGVSTGTNGTCVGNFPSAGSTISFDIELQANQTYSLFTNPSSNKFLAQVEIPSGLAAAFAKNTAPTPSILTYRDSISGYGVPGVWSCRPRTDIIGDALQSGYTRVAWECDGNVGLVAKDFNRDASGKIVVDERGIPKTGGDYGYGPAYPSLITLKATLQANAGFNPVALNHAGGNLTLNWTFFPYDVFQDTLSKSLGYDFENNVGARVTATASGVAEGSAIC